MKAVEPMSAEAIRRELLVIIANRQLHPQRPQYDIHLVEGATQHAVRTTLGSGSFEQAIAAGIRYLKADREQRALMQLGRNPQAIEYTAELRMQLNGKPMQISLPERPAATAPSVPVAEAFPDVPAAYQVLPADDFDLADAEEMAYRIFVELDLLHLFYPRDAVIEAAKHGCKLRDERHGSDADAANEGLAYLRELEPTELAGP